MKLICFGGEKIAFQERMQRKYFHEMIRKMLRHSKRRPTIFMIFNFAFVCILHPDLRWQIRAFQMDYLIFMKIKWIRSITILFLANLKRCFLFKKHFCTPWVGSKYSNDNHVKTYVLRSMSSRHKSLMELLLSNVAFFMMENPSDAVQSAFCIENSVLRRIFGMRFEMIIKIVKTALFLHRLHLFACVDMCVAKRVIHSKYTIHSHTQHMMY